MIEKLGAVFSDDYIIFGNIDSDLITLFSNEIDLNSIRFNNVNLDDDSFDHLDPKTINYIRLMAWYNIYKQQKMCEKKIDEELLTVAWLQQERGIGVCFKMTKRK